MSPKKKTHSKVSEKQDAFKAGDIVLGKMRGFPLWPGMIAAEEDLPERTREIQPVARSRTYFAVRWIPQGDHDWLSSTDIIRLTPEAITSFLEDDFDGKNKERYGIGRADVKKAYQAAADPATWQQTLAEVKPRKEQRKQKDDAGNGKQAEGTEDQAHELGEEGVEIGEKRKRDTSSAKRVAKPASKRNGNASQTQPNADGNDENKKSDDADAGLQDEHLDGGVESEDELRTGKEHVACELVNWLTGGV
ncbi:hypothetical protein C8F01DRAFT_1253201 [Mycena amicta]|nr:hypothetical protein C8F01DRAFT_1253201 [Mycena amicta]